MSTDKKDEKDEKDEMVRTSFYIPQSVLDDAKKIGLERDRNLSYMVRYFLNKGLEAEKAAA